MNVEILNPDTLAAYLRSEAERLRQLYTIDDAREAAYDVVAEAFVSLALRVETR